MQQKPTKTFSAHDFVNQFLELWDLNPDFEQWTDQQFADNPPRYIRLERNMALFRAFGIPWNPTGFSAGLFIHITNPLYSPFLERTVGAVTVDKRRGLSACFETLFRYRVKIEALRTFSNGVFGAGGLVAYAHRKAWSATEMTLENVEEIDNDLAFIVDPGQRNFSEEELVTVYGYPEEDLSSIDMDWW